MSEKEFTQAKQCALTTRDWDTYQVILRTCLSPTTSNFSFHHNTDPEHTHFSETGGRERALNR